MRHLVIAAALALASLAQAAPQFTATAYTTPTLASEALRVSMEGTPYLLPLPTGVPYSSFGWQVGDANSQNILIASRLVSAGPAFHAIVYDTTDGTLGQVVASFAPGTQGYDVNERGDYLIGTSSGLLAILADGGSSWINGNHEAGSYRRPSFNSMQQLVADDFFHDATGRYQLAQSIVGTVPFTSFVATDINDAGMVAGYGLNRDGQLSAFVLSPVPVPEPAAWALLLAIGLASAVSRHRIPHRPRQ